MAASLRIWAGTTVSSLVLAAIPAAASTPSLDLTTTSLSAGTGSNGSFDARFALAPAPLVDVSFAAGLASDDRGAQELSRRTFLTGEARMELADGQWLQTFNAAYTDLEQERHEGIDADELDLAHVRSGTRRTLGALSELRLSQFQTLTLAIQARRETLEERVRIDVDGARHVRGRTRADSRQSTALVESRTRVRGVDLELGARLETPNGLASRPSARMGLSYTLPRFGTRISTSGGLGFADPARLQASLASTLSARRDAIKAEIDADPSDASAWRIDVRQSFLGGRLTTGASLASSRVSGSHAPLGGWMDSLELGDVGLEVRTRGERMDAFVAFTPIDLAKLELTYTDAEATLDAVSRARATLRRRTARASLTVTPLRDTSLGVTLRHVGARDASPGLADAPGGYDACDLSASYKLGSRLRIVMRVENLLRRGAGNGERVRPTGTLSLQGQL